MFAPGGRIWAWLRGSLRRWLVMPVAAVALLLSVGAGGLGISIIGESLSGSYRTWVTAFFVLMLSLGTLAVLLLARQLAAAVVRPIAAIAEAAQLVARGESVHVARAEEIGELAGLAKAFDEMASRVHEQTATLREQARQAKFLFEGSGELGSTLDFDESLQTAADVIFRLGDLSYVLVLTGRGELGPYTCAAVRGLPADTGAAVLGHEYRIPLWGFMARALVSRQPVVIPDLAGLSRPRAGEFNWDTGAGSMLLFPICDASGPFALLVVGSSQAGAFGEGQVGDLVFALARIAAHSIQNAHLYREAIRSQEQLVTVQMISHVVASSTQIDRVLETIMREASEITSNSSGDSQAWLYLKHPEDGAGQLYSRSSGAEGPGEIYQEAIAWVMQAGQPIFFRPDAPLMRSPILAHGGPAMCVPLEAAGSVIGALVVAHRDPQRTYAEDDMIVLRTLANAAAVALHGRQSAGSRERGYLELARVWAAQSDVALWGDAGHAARVAANALRLARAVDVPDDLQRVLQVAAYLHQIAATSADEDTIISKPPQPARHAAEATGRLAEAGVDGRVVTLVRYHQSARPDLVIGDDDLGRAAGVLSLAHAADVQAMQALQDARLSPAPQPPLQVEDICARLAHSNDAGGMFSPLIVEKYVDLLRAGQIAVPGM